ncbi:bifunctional DedA family/phosphatase PAP2 family protein [Aquilutibacter rugosus]|uniref:bifunctional DedA family/phosphatase PAP2 family protein n=1 Tax=Aquilutibacter rugosus TaxID=3115820 RepID=UPI002F4002F9
MNSSWLESTIAWITAHPNAAGFAIFLVAFLDSMILAGIVVPALPLLIAIGTIVGMGHIDPLYAIVSAALGAVAGDGLSYWVGRRWGHSLLQIWPFNKYPGLIIKAETLFKRRGVSSIIIARFVGAIRPFVPAIAGMSRMPLRRYLPINLFAALTWAALFLLPGMLLGASYNIVAAVADRLAIVVGGLLLTTGMAVATVYYAWKWSAHNADFQLARLLAWSKRHPLLGRFAQGVVDPNRPESPSLLILGVCLLLLGWAWFALLAVLLANGGALGIDHAIYDFLWGLRNPLADRLMTPLATLGDAQVMGPALLVGLLYLAWRKRWKAVTHWLIAIGFGVVLTYLLAAAIDFPAPPAATQEFSFPAVSITMSTIVLSFFAVLISREFPRKSRVWPYLLAGLIVTLTAAGRLYLGMHWFSDLVGSMLLGLTWVMVVGIAYRSHHTRGFWMRPIALVFYVTMLGAAIWHLPRASEPLLQRLAANQPTRNMASAYWLDQGWSELPGRRNEADARSRWDLNLQVAGSDLTLRRTLEGHGFVSQPAATWIDVVTSLNTGESPFGHKVLPASFESHPETLLMVRDVPDGTREVVRLWPSGVILDGRTPLWIGNVQTMRYDEPYGALGLWRPVADSEAAYTYVLEALQSKQAQQSVHPQTGRTVLRLDLSQNQ